MQLKKIRIYITLMFALFPAFNLQGELFFDGRAFVWEDPSDTQPFLLFLGSRVLVVEEEKEWVADRLNASG